METRRDGLAMSKTAAPMTSLSIREKVGHFLAVRPGGFEFFGGGEVRRMVRAVQGIFSPVLTIAYSNGGGNREEIYSTQNKPRGIAASRTSFTSLGRVRVRSAPLPHRDVLAFWIEVVLAMLPASPLACDHVKRPPYVSLMRYFCTSLPRPPLNAHDLRLSRPTVEVGWPFIGSFRFAEPTAG
jgi:hypothetical protein